MSGSINNFNPSKMALPRRILHPPSPSPSPSHPHTKFPLTLLLIIIILAALFFTSPLLYFLIKTLKKTRNPSPSNLQSAISTAEALQRQLHQLFNLNDSGLDQASIDSLPVFSYKEILAPKEPFDCAVCLCEFSPKDKLRLLPNCSHAFHIKCIDTWLQSNSSCPLCRGAILAPGLLFDSPNSDSDKSPLAVRLGKFRKVGNGDSFVGEASNSSLDARRCYSMGSYQYVVGNTNLRVTLCPRKRKAKNSPDDVEGRKISSVSKGDSYSISKIWLWKKKGAECSQIDLPRLGSETESPVMEGAESV